MSRAGHFTAALKAHSGVPSRSAVSLALLLLGVLLLFSAPSPFPLATPLSPSSPLVALGLGISTISLPLPSSSPTPPPASPSKLRIPALSISSPVVSVGLVRGAIGTPCDNRYPYRYCNTNAVAWYNGSPLPGAPGDAILDGHDNWYGPHPPLYVPAAFTHLPEAKIGDQIIITTTKGQVLVFIVDSVLTLTYPAAPSNTYTSTGKSSLMLITCGGVYNPKLGVMDKRVYVHALLVSQGLPPHLDKARKLLPFK